MRTASASANRFAQRKSRAGWLGCGNLGAAPKPPPEKPGTLSLGLDAAEAPAGKLRPWIEVAFPHTDVLENRYKQSEFAADLAAVDLGQASEDYSKPDNFFRITFLTEGLKRVLRTALTVDPRTAGRVPSTKGSLGG